VQRLYRGAEGIRGLACLLVLLAHAPGFFIPAVAAYFSGTGKFGVWLFFVLSAFLLTSKFERTGFRPEAIASYAIGRFLRIIPIFLIVVILCYFLGAAGVLSLSDVVSAISFQKGYAHLWTIPVEFKFYFLLPFFAYAFISVTRGFGQTGAFVLVVALIAVTQLIWPFWLTPENSIFTHWYLPSFILGSYAAVSIEFFRSKITDNLRNVLAIAAMFAIVVLTPYFRQVLFQMPLDGWLQNKFILLSLLWVVFLLSAIDGKGLFGGLMRTLVLMKLGKWSFSIYLIHWIIYGYLASVHIGNGFVWSVIAILSSIAVGAMLFILIESKIERLRHIVQIRINISDKT